MIEGRELAIRDEVLVETEIDETRVVVPAMVTNVLPDALWLVQQSPDLATLLAMEEGQALHLTFVRDGTPVVAESAFLKRLGGVKLGTEKSRVFSVVRPLGAESAERRSHVRIDVERTVYLKIRAPIAGGPPRVVKAKTVNVSAGGLLQLVTSHPLVVGDQLNVALVLRATEVVTTAAQVVRVEPASPEGGESDRVAVRFERISEANQERIACHILAERRNRANHRVAEPVEETAAEPEALPAGQADADPERVEVAVES